MIEHALPARVLPLCLAALALGCGTDAAPVDEADGTESAGTETGPASPQSAQSEVPRNLTPSPSTAELEQMRLGERAFAHELYGEVSATEVEAGDNLILSPYCLRSAFGMSWAGAVEATETEMAEVLRFDLGQAPTHEVMNYVDLALADRNDVGDEDNPPIILLSNNRFFVHFDFPVLDSYLDVLAENYGADVKLVDFREGEPSRQQINQWVSDKTQERISELLPPSSIVDLSPLGGTVSVLVNTLYLKAPWAEAFPDSATAPAPFTLRDGSQTSVAMMRQDAVSVGYALVDGFEVVDLPLREGQLSLTLILPPVDSDALDTWLDPEQLEAIEDGLVTTHVELRLPRFEIEPEASLALRSSFMSLGMEAPFGGGFDNAYPGGGVFIDDIYHQVFFAVDEAGVEGAAATAIVNGLGFTPSEPPTAEYSVTFDRPFLLLLRDRDTGTMLFMGRVTQPTPA
ncbi:serpin family protein [Enhygromyxa salina]|nr:serpin family protein [Enhygromyxa salina]